MNEATIHPDEFYKWVIVIDRGAFLSFLNEKGADTIYIKLSNRFPSKEATSDAFNKYKSKNPNETVKVMTYYDADKFNRQLQLRFS